MELACQCPAVVCCRCAPTQKAQIVRLLQERTGKLTCAVGRLAQGQEGGAHLGARQACLGGGSQLPEALSCWPSPVTSCSELTFDTQPESDS